MDPDILGIVEWLQGSDWSLDMYDYTDELYEQFGRVTVDKYWRYSCILIAMTDPKFEGRREVLRMLEYVADVGWWDTDLEDYFDDIADAWGRDMAKKFCVGAIAKYIENRWSL